MICSIYTNFWYYKLWKYLLSSMIIYYKYNIYNFFTPKTKTTMNIKNKVIIITGGTGGIWEAISLSLAEKWAKVVAVYKGNTEKAETFRDKISRISSDFLILRKDVTHDTELEEIFTETVEHFWKPDILINNAGGINKAERTTREKLEFGFNLNFFQVVLATELFQKYRNQQELWKIINISSIAGVAPWTFTGWLRYPEYSCAKAAVDSYTKQCAKSFDGNILVNAIAPGNVETPNWEGADKDFCELRAQESMINRFLEPRPRNYSW